MLKSIRVYAPKIGRQNTVISAPQRCECSAARIMITRRYKLDHLILSLIGLICLSRLNTDKRPCKPHLNAIYTSLSHTTISLSRTVFRLAFRKKSSGHFCDLLFSDNLLTHASINLRDFESVLLFVKTPTYL